MRYNIIRLRNKSVPKVRIKRGGDRKGKIGIDQMAESVEVLRQLRVLIL